MKPDGILYELQDRVIVERQPIGEQEEINGFLGGEVTVDFKRLNLPYFIPKQALIKVPDRESDYSPDALVINPKVLITTAVEKVIISIPAKAGIDISCHAFKLHIQGGRDAHPTIHRIVC